MFALDPHERPCAEECLKHPFFHRAPLPCKPEELPRYPEIHCFEAIQIKEKQDKMRQRPLSDRNGNDRQYLERKYDFDRTSKKRPRESDQPNNGRTKRPRLSESDIHKTTEELFQELLSLPELSNAGKKSASPNFPPLKVSPGLRKRSPPQPATSPEQNQPKQPNKEDPKDSLKETDATGAPFPCIEMTEKQNTQIRTRPNKPQNNQKHTKAAAFTHSSKQHNSSTAQWMTFEQMIQKPLRIRLSLAGSTNNNTLKVPSISSQPAQVVIPQTNTVSQGAIPKIIIKTIMPKKELPSLPKKVILKAPECPKIIVNTAPLVPPAIDTVLPSLPASTPPKPLNPYLAPARKRTDLETAEANQSRQKVLI